MFVSTEGYFLYVTDILPGREFYGRVLMLPVIDEKQGRVAFKIPGSRLVLIGDESGAPPLDSTEEPTGESPNAMLVLLVEDVDSALFHLDRAGVRFLSPIEDRDGLWIAEILDPYGNRIGIAQLNELR